MLLHRTVISLIAAIIVLTLISQSVGVVHQGQIGVRLRAGTVTETDLKPGLHFKLPFIDHIAELDAHWITLDGERQNGGRMRFVSADRKTLEAGYAAAWHITNATAFCSATGCDESAGAQRINDALIPLLRQLFAAHTGGALQADEGGALMKSLPANLNVQLHNLGLEVQAVYLTALTLPQDQLDAVYQRMRAAQSEQAAQIRAQGIASADGIRARADQQQASILGQAEIQAQKTRGLAEAQAAAIYARAYNQDPELFRFYRSLETYRHVLKKDDSIIVLGLDSGFLKYFDGPKPVAPQHH